MPKPLESIMHKRSELQSRHRATVGILGGGQLSRMLAEAALRLGTKVKAFAEGEHSSVSHILPETAIGRITDGDAIRHFLSQVDVVIFESEFVDCELLEKASQGLDVKFLPSLQTMSKLRDKLSQKQVLKSLQIPTAEYFEYGHGDDVEEWVKNALTKFQGHAVFKWAQLGYDGHGVMLVDDFEDGLPKGMNFCRQAIQRQIGIYVEEKIDFKRELAIVSTYSINNEFTVYPLVISEQEEGICKRVYGPATALGVALELEEKAKAYAEKLAKSLSIYGTFALELFETRQGELFVNEIAPRVHNSGHCTLNSAATSQFENHCRAMLGLSLGSTESVPGFAMLNLLGPKGVHAAESEAAVPKPSQHLHLHWYNKSEIRPRRKLGHLNGVVESANMIGDLLKELDECERDWAARLSNKRSDSHG